MPANRRPVDRDAKRDEIVHAAERLFVEVGYEATTMAHLAEAAGVTRNTIYWYFDDKDAVLIAVLDNLLQEALQEHAQQAALPWQQQAAWAVGRLSQLHRLVSVVHVRAATSAALAVWHDSFHALADALLADGLRRAGVPEADLPAASRIGTFVVEGLLSHPLDTTSQEDVLRLLGRIAAPTEAAGEPVSP